MYHSHIKPALILSSLLWLLVSTAKASEVIEIRHPFNSDNLTYQKRDQYFLKLLTRAMDLVGQKYQLIDLPVPTLPEDRSMKLINDGYYTLHWMGTNLERETKLLPVKIPLEKGLIGWRLLLVHRDNLQEFSAITNVNELKKRTAGLGHDWPDTDIFRANKLRLFTATSSSALYKMLRLKRLDYFPRSILEIWQEHATLDYPELAVDQHIVLTYPTAVYFFISKKNVELHRLVETGLQLAIKDGSFDKIFYQHFGSAIAKANLSQRLRLHIPSPLIDETMLGRPELWFSAQTQ